MMSKKKMIIWIMSFGVATILASQAYAGGLCGMPGMSGGGSCCSHEQKHQQSPTTEMVKCTYDGMEMDRKEMKAYMKYKGQI